MEAVRPFARNQQAEINLGRCPYQKPIFNKFDLFFVSQNIPFLIGYSLKLTLYLTFVTIARLSYIPS